MNPDEYPAWDDLDAYDAWRLERRLQAERESAEYWKREQQRYWERHEQFLLDSIQHLKVFGEEDLCVSEESPF